MKKKCRPCSAGATLQPGKKLISFLVVIALGLLSPFFLTAQVLCQRQLVWQDEFNTPGNLSKWIVYEGDGCNQGSGCGFGNGELQLYRAANAVVADTTLTIFTRNETVVNPVNNRTYQYTSAKLMSKLVGGVNDLQSFQFGRIEARMKLPSAGGAWPAFWMLPDVGGWPNTGEIDIMEAKHKNPVVFNGTLHYAYPTGVHQQSGMQYPAGVDLSTGFHVYAVEWSPYKIEWYIDNVLFQTQTPETTIGGSWPFDASKMYIILNTAVGGPNTPYTGKIPPTPADYPTNMKVDYVRVYNGIYNYAVYGKNAVYPNETFADYRIDTIPGATYNWVVPAGATIVSGQGTNAISMHWGTTPGDVTVNVTTPGCSVKSFSRKVAFKQPLGASKVYDDFEGTRLATYGPLTGTLQQAVANPLAERMNTSSLVGKYTRNAAIQYDNFYIGSMGTTNAMDFVQGRKKLFIDVYTTAPVGTEVDMQLENTALSTVNAFPSGRHSKYVAYTTRQNSWQTLEFNYTQTIANSNTSIFAIDKMAILPEPGKFTANLYYFDNVRVAESPAAAWTIIAADTLENYNGISLITFDNTITNGTYTPSVNNPAPGTGNTSSTVARYVRNPTEAYDVLFFNTANTIPSAGPFKNQVYQVQVDVYTSAPIGTEVSINLQNKTLAMQPFPSGRNSSYQSITTKQNQWETLTFYYSSAPNGASNLAIDQLVFLFSPNKPAVHTYYIDNIRIGKKVTYGTAGSTVFEDYDASHLFTYQLSDGVYVPNSANPAPNAVNSSALTGKYTRSAAAPYDVVFFTTASIKDGEQFKQNAKLFAMDVYTTAPVGTPISWQLESSAKSNGSNYPRGRHSNYQGKVTQTNAWHTIYFYLDAVPDANTLDAEVDRVVLLFAPNTATNHIYYIDNLRALNGTTSVVPPVTGLPSPWQNADIGAVAAAGSATFSNSVFTVKGSGADIWGTADEFHYVYQPFSGNGQIIARVDTLGNTNGAAKAAVMFRETLAANSKEVNSLVKATGGTSISYRTSTAGTTTSVNAAGTPPKWLKLVRNGDAFTASRSDDGVNWTVTATRTVAMTANIYVGLAVTSHNDGVLTTSRFSNVSVSSGTGLMAATTSPIALAEDVAHTTGLQLYPNPAKDQIRVQWGGEAHQLLLYDVSGRLVLTRKVARGQQSANLNLANLSKGLYLLQVGLIDGIRTIKFQKE